METHQAQTQQDASTASGTPEAASSWREDSSQHHGNDLEAKVWGWLMTIALPVVLVLGTAYLLLTVVLLVFFPDSELAEQLRTYVSQPTCGPVCAA